MNGECLNGVKWCSVEQEVLEHRPWIRKWKQLLVKGVQDCSTNVPAWVHIPRCPQCSVTLSYHVDELADFFIPDFATEDMNLSYIADDAATFYCSLRVYRGITHTNEQQHMRGIRSHILHTSFHFSIERVLQFLTLLKPGVLHCFQLVQIFLDLVAMCRKIFKCAGT